MRTATGDPRRRFACRRAFAISGVRAQYDVSADGSERSVQVLAEVPAGLQGIATDADGELYALTDAGMFRLVPA